MLKRCLHILLSLVAVVVSYGVYSLLVAPWIVPDTRVETPRIDFRQFSKSPRQVKSLAQYFDAGDWESKQPIVIEKPEFALLLQNYESTVDEQLKIKPCTFIFFPEGRSSSVQEKPVVILQAPEGAILDFEGGCDLARAKIGHLQGGRLLGKVSIKNRDPQNDPEKLFALTTRDVELREDRLWSRDEVVFRLGTTRGHGRGLQMQFRLNSEPVSTEAGSDMQALERIELVQDVHLALNLESKPLLPADPFSKSAKEQPQQVGATPVEIRCAGRFRWDTAKMLATFEDQVDVIRSHPQGPPDRLTCDTLAIYFAENPAEARAPKKAGSFDANMSPSRLIADGNPVQISTPQWQSTAIGQHLEVEIATRRLILRGQAPVTLTHQESSLTAMDIDYRPGADDDLGTLQASGPGRLVSRGEDAGSSFEASWKKKLEMKPHEKGQVISILGGGRIQHAESSALQAEKIWLWLDRLPRSEQSETAQERTAWKNWIPHSALAVEKVRMHGDRLAAVSDRLEVWFEQRAEEDSELPENRPANNSFLGSSFSSPEKNNVNATQNPALQESQYQIRGDLIQLTVALSGQGRPSPTAASVSGNVKLIEQGTDQAPFTVHGDHLDLFDADTSEAVVSLTGQPARATGRSAAITGNTLQLERGTGRMWVRGAGTMQLPLDRDLQGKPLDTVELLDITWNGQMHFDSQTISFDKDVFAKTKNQQLRTSSLKVTLNRQLNFSQPIERDALELQQISCTGGVHLVNREVENGRELAFDQLQTDDLNIEQPSGRLVAQGPGFLTSVREGNASTSPLRLTGTADKTSANQETKRGINYLRVDFSRGLAGNVHHRELTFLERVLCTYGPVAHRQAEVTIDPVTGPVGDQVVLNCNRLTVRQMGKPRGTARPVEMEAIGESLVTGEGFRASGNRMTYTTGKELFVLEGADGTYAQLLRQTQGAPPSNLTAQKIYFWRSENRVQMDGIRLFNGNLPPAEEGK